MIFGRRDLKKDALLYLMLFFAMLSILVAIGCVQPALASPFVGGDGTPESPYQISAPEQLSSVRDAAYLDKSFVLINDLDLSDMESWAPIGTAEAPFTGTFDGRLFCISLPPIGSVAIGIEGIDALEVDQNHDDVGLFGVSQGVIKDLEVDIFSCINGTDNVGAIVGHNQGVITSSVAAIGSSVQGTSNVGGLAGRNDGTISNCYALLDADLTGGQNVGGLVGAVGSEGSVVNSFVLSSSGSISGENNVGGLAGLLESGCSVHCTYAAVQVAGPSNVGGLVGTNSGGTVSASYYDTDVAEQSDTGKGMPKTTADMQAQETFDGWDFAEVWRFPLDHSWMTPYPSLRINLPASAVQALTPEDEAVGVGIDAALSVEFDRNVYVNDAKGIRVEHEDDESGQIQELTGVTAEVTGGDTVLINHPDFTYGTTYFVTISENSLIGYSNYAWDTGNEEVTWSFAVSGAGFSDFGFAEQVSEPTLDPVGGTIAVVVRYGTDLSNLVANFAVPASVQSVQVAGVDQVSGETANDFSQSEISPVTYTVGAKDGTSKDFKVTVAAAPDQSGFGLALAEAGDKIHGETFAINISDAKDVYGAGLAGDYAVTITSDQADGAVFSGSAHFTNGTAAVSISLETVVTHDLTVRVDGVTNSRSLAVSVIAEPAPRPQTLTPLAGGASMDLDQPVSVEFDRDITVKALSGIKIEYVADGTTQLLGGVSGTLNGRTLTLTHDQFTQNTVYRVTIPSEAVQNSDDIGNAAVTWEFTVLPAGYFAGGSGTEQDPFLVASAEQLNNVRELRRLHYRLINDLDLSGYANWDPIGDFAQPFTGAFDGDYHLISNLNIDRAGEDYVGLFGHSLGGVIKNLSVAGNVSGSSYVGILVGSNYTMEIYGGRTLVATINDCSVSGEVQGTSHVGGLAGQSYGQVANSFSAATVSGGSDVGGLAGRLMEYSMVNSYATGAVAGANRVGGLLGSIQSGAEVKTSFAAGSVTGGSNAGGLVGYKYYGTVSDSYYDAETTGRTPNGLGIPRTTAEMQDQVTFTGWDFDSVWSMQAGTYPFLQALSPFPIAKALLPADGAEAVAVDAAISVEFDQDVSAGDLSGIKIEYCDGGTMRPVANVSAVLTARTITISHDRFAYGTEYTVTIPASAVTSSALHGGNPGFTWGFTTDPASMLSYGFAEQTGSAVIDHAAGTIAVEVRYGTDLSRLAAIFTTSASIQLVEVNGNQQTSGETINDFHNAVTYTLTADGLSRTYVVTVSVAADQSDFTTALAAVGNPVAGTAFGLDLAAARDAYGDLLNGDFAVTVTSDEEGAVFSGLASFHNGQSSVESVTLATIGEHTLTITVAGITGSRNLLVIVVSPPSSDKAITAFGFSAMDNSALTSDVLAVINGTDISAVLPHGTDLTILVAGFTTTGKTVTVGEAVQTTGVTVNDFSSQVIYTVTAEDGSSQSYTVTVTVDPDQSGFALATAAGTKQTGIPFVLQIAGAKNFDGRYLNGTVDVEVSVEDIMHADSDAKTVAQSTAFVDGNADVSITINDMDPAISITSYRLTVRVAGITASQAIDCSVEQQPAPAAESLTPASGAGGAALDAAVSMLFDRDIVAKSLDGVEIQWLDDQTYRRLAGTSAAIQSDGRTLVISHGEFRYDTEYRVIIPRGAVENTAGIASADVISWIFTTRAAPDAGIVSRAPAVDAQAVAVDAAVSIEFGHNVTAQLLGEIKIEYVKNGVTLAADGVLASLGDDHRTLAITHGRLAYGTTYAVTIPEGAFRDADGLNSPAIIWSFTTKQEPIAAEITYSPDSLTNGDVTAELTFLNTDTGSAPSQNPYSATETVHTFVKNGTHTFTYSDGEGNSYSLDAVVNWIDKTPPTATITYTPAVNTKYSVQAAVQAEDDRGEVVVFTQPGGADTHTFATNGAYDFVFRDEAGNVNTITATVDWIKPACQPQITYSAENPTQAAVTATVSFPGWTGVQITNNDGDDTYTFNDNGEFTFTYRDPDGDEGSAFAKVAWIDRSAPSGQLVYEPATPTTGSVIVTIQPTDNLSDYAAGEIRIIQPADGDTHTFKYNSSFDFILEDAAGNRGTVTAVVDWIDRQITDNLHVEYSTVEPAQSVVATVIIDGLKEGIRLVPPGQSNFHLFEANGEYTWQFADAEGNNGSITAKVDWIDRLAPTMDVAFSPETFTNQAVVVTITGADSPADVDNIMSGLTGLTWTASDNVSYAEQGAGVYTLTFSDNASVQVTLPDKAGNVVQQTIEVDWIDQEPPSFILNYSTELPTKDNVVATLALHDHNAHPSTIVNADRDQLRDYPYILPGEGNDYSFAEAPVFTFTFTENGSFVFKAADQAGNISEIPVTVANIDKVPPTVELTYSTEQNTPYEVKAYLRSPERFYDGLTHQAAERVFDDAAQFLYFQMEHTFWVNGDHTFVYEDQVGNSGQVTASVSWIENRPPEVYLEYYFPRWTSGSVEVRLYLRNDFKKGWHITNNNGSNVYTFSDNGTFAFEYANDYGAAGEITATVDWIDKTPPVVDQIRYSPGGSSPTPGTYGIISVYGHDHESGMVGTGVDKFTVTANGDYTFEISDRVGNKTQIPLTVTWIDRTPPEVSPQGDFSTVTNQDLTISLVADEKVTITSAYMPYEYQGASLIWVDQQGELTAEHTAVLKKNGIYRIGCRDEAGNETRMEFEVKNIDQEPPEMHADSRPILVVSRKEAEDIRAILKMRATDARDGDLTAEIEFREVSRQMRDDGDEAIVYQCSATDAAGNSSAAITRTVVISAKTRPTFYVDGQSAGGKVTLTLAPGETAASVALDYAGFFGEYALKMAAGEKPAAFFKSALTSRIFYSSEFSVGDLPPLRLAPGVYTIYGYDAETGYVALVIEVKGGK